MSFIGTIGVVAQQGNQGGIGGGSPTNVSIAENASTGENNALKTEETTGTDDFFDVDYSDWGTVSNGTVSTESYGKQLEIEVGAGDLGDWDSYGRIMMRTFAYLRATGATSYSWAGSIYDDNFGTGSGDASGQIVGTSSDSQDSTGGTGTGIIFRINPGSDKAGNPAWPVDGEYIIFKLTGTATNSSGDTTADLYLKYSFAN